MLATSPRRVHIGARVPELDAARFALAAQLEGWTVSSALRLAMARFAEDVAAKTSGGRASQPDRRTEPEEEARIEPQG